VPVCVRVCACLIYVSFARELSTLGIFGVVWRYGDMDVLGLGIGYLRLGSRISHSIRNSKSWNCIPTGIGA
jgi:hypothetical protein